MIPVIDLGPYLAARPGASTATAAELDRALRDVGFFVVVNHGIPQALIDDTFAEARRFHAQPMDAKLTLRMNEHNNGYMMLGRYAVWTSDVNANDKPDLNEAFFVKRERGPDDPLVRARRRFAGPNQWPADLPGFRDAVLAYTDCLVLDGGRTPDGVFAALKQHLSDEEILELTYVTTLYEMHATMSRALRTEWDDRDDPVVEVPGPHESLAPEVGVEPGRTAGDSAEKS